MNKVAQRVNKPCKELGADGSWWFGPEGSTRLVFTESGYLGLVKRVRWLDTGR